MNKIEIIATINDVNLCRKNDFYFIKRNDGFMWDMVGTKEEVKNYKEKIDIKIINEVSQMIITDNKKKLDLVLPVRLIA